MRSTLLREQKRRNRKKSSLSFVNLAVFYMLLRDVSRNEFFFFFSIRPLMRTFTLGEGELLLMLR